MTEQKSCIKCGEPLNEKAVFCPSCGTKQTAPKTSSGTKPKPRIKVPVEKIDLKEIEESAKQKRRKKISQAKPVEAVKEDSSVKGLIHADTEEKLEAEKPVAKVTERKPQKKETGKVAEKAVPDSIPSEKNKTFKEDVVDGEIPEKREEMPYKETQKKTGSVTEKKTENAPAVEDTEKVDIQDKKVDIQEEKVDIQEEKVDMEEPEKEFVPEPVAEKVAEEPIPETEIPASDVDDQLATDPLMIFGVDADVIVEEPEIKEESVTPSVIASELKPHIELEGKELDDYAAEELRRISLNEKMETTLYPLITKSTRGFRCIFLGARGTPKEDKFNEVAKLLYDIGKTDREKPEYITFGEIPEKFDTKKVYVIDDLQSAITHLFNLEDFSENASEQQRHYQDLMEHLISASRNAYIFLNSNQAEIRGFITLDARLTFMFDNRVIFENLTNEEIYDKYKILIPDTHIGQINSGFRDYFLGYLERNRRFFPFENAELSSFLASYSIREEQIKLPAEKFNPNTLEETFNKIIGMENVKSQVRELNQYLSVRQKLTDAGATLPDFNMHMMFLGNPGVGKTSIARIISKILFDLGYCREEKLVEVTSKDLVGAYGNQTGIKTNRAIMKALGGVLFVDEAYSLSNSCGQAGAEAIAIIIKAMMDYKNDLVVMFAGYSLEMRTFVESNSGISSRINYIFKFEDYSPAELFDIFMLKLGFCGMTLDPDAKVPVEKLCKFASGRKNAGNGRFIDNLIQKALTKHALLDLKGEDILVLNKKSIPSVEDIMSTTFN